MSTTAVVEFPVHDWNAPVDADQAGAIADALEDGAVVRFPKLPFALQPSEAALLEAAVLSGRKNISYRPAGRSIKGMRGDAAAAATACGLLERYYRSTRSLVAQLYPAPGALIDGRGSLRPAEIEGRLPKSWRKDDTRLHVDAFPATPVQGRRILRVFSNVHPGVRERVWQVGERFGDVARHFFPRLPAPNPLAARLMELARITRGRRTGYDHYMLNLHDAMKQDVAYQSGVGKTTVRFAPGETWMVYTDLVSHAALAGRHALEQTFYVPPQALRHRERAPFAILEKLAGRPLLAS